MKNSLIYFYYLLFTYFHKCQRSPLVVVMYVLYVSIYLFPPYFLPIWLNTGNPFQWQCSSGCPRCVCETHPLTLALWLIAVCCAAVSLPLRWSFSLSLCFFSHWRRASDVVVGWAGAGSTDTCTETQRTSCSASVLWSDGRGGVMGVINTRHTHTHTHTPWIHTHTHTHKHKHTTAVSVRIKAGSPWCSTWDQSPARAFWKSFEVKLC